jgi:hypothetical protein
MAWYRPEKTQRHKAPGQFGTDLDAGISAG